VREGPQEAGGVSCCKRYANAELQSVMMVYPHCARKPDARETNEDRQRQDITSHYSERAAVRAIRS
jgi:hypothetical protein